MRLPFSEKVVAHSEISHTCVVEETSTRRSDGTFPAGKVQSEGATGVEELAGDWLQNPSRDRGVDPTTEVSPGWVPR